MRDLGIRGAIVVEGLGHDPINADVAVSNGRIAAVGNVARDAAEIVDAGGLALMPGIIHRGRRACRPAALRPCPPGRGASRLL